MSIWLSSTMPPSAQRLRLLQSLYRPPILDGRRQRRIAPGHRKIPRLTDRHRDEPIMIVRTGDTVATRPLDFYQAVGQRMAQGERP
ncbi:hypothetical protein [Bradyrhizobium sp. 195]|uniref:hypothetical protein n=1 Tax=Bradyrhizobium sp. 195 TaxID=2782662 RepID=UPI0020007E72|nr:hypothetical protein [Bradyrhizobium sp. 195]UPK28226.1 hypothetical protein IVB26_06960 [Bradyrhizobium sp. 195]